MAQKVFETTVDLPFSKDDARAEVFGRFEDVRTDVRPVGDVFGDNDHALGNQNTTAHNSVAFEPLKAHPDFVSRNQIPTQAVELFGPIGGAVALSDCLIDHGNQLAAEAELGGDTLSEQSKATIIRQMTEKYAFNMWVGEGAVAEAIDRELGWDTEERTLKEIVQDETGRRDGVQGKADLTYENGNTVQVKCGRRKRDGCTHAAKVEPHGSDSRTATVTLYEY